jgi:hypothetical protein
MELEFVPCVLIVTVALESWGAAVTRMEVALLLMSFTA